MPQHPSRPGSVARRLEVRGAPAAGVGTDATARHINNRHEKILEGAAVVEFLKVKPAARDSSQHRGLPTESGLLTVAGFKANALQRTVSVGGPAHPLNDTDAKEIPLALQGPPTVGEEIKLPQSLFEDAQLGLGPLMPGQALRQRLQGNVQFGQAHELPNQDGFVPDGVGQPEHELDVFCGRVRVPECQLGRRAELQDLNRTLEDRVVRQENRRRIVCVVAQVEPGIGAPAGGTEFLEDRLGFGQCGRSRQSGLGHGWGSWWVVDS